VLVDEPATQARLSNLVHSISADCNLYDDLLQEALIHLWQQESRSPGQTQSWYVQSCRFHLLDYLRQGHSVDSLKRRHHACPLPEEFESWQPAPEAWASAESVWDAVSARDLADCIGQHANNTEKQILAYLDDGLRVSEIGEQLHISQQATSKHRRRIATLALQLGITPLPQRHAPS
jgi:RNA polymerase sigma factor (sigma-70 family)